MAVRSDPPIVLQTEHLSEAAATWLAERAQLIACDPTSEAERFAQLLREAEGLVVRTYTRVDASMLEGAPSLRVVGRAGVGLDNIDLDACRRRDVAVVHTPDANTQAVVEFVLRQLLTLLRPVERLNAAVDAKRWAVLRRERCGERQLGDLEFGVLGFGRIGSRIAAAMSGLGTQVRYNELREISEQQRGAAQPVPVEELFEACDVVSIHVDGRASNRGFVGRDLLDRMRSDAILINTSRGFVVDGAALRHAMEFCPQRSALIDVHAVEPIPADDPLLGLGNVVLTPHLASRTRPAMDAMSWVVRDVMAVLEGRQPQFVAT